MSTAGQAIVIPEKRAQHSDKRGAILDAFEHCIASTGFHRTTMQDVAQALGMSVGNLYRYFDSKEALVSGLVERDRERLRADFDVTAESKDVMGALRQLGRKHFVEEPRERAMQIVQIWAEAMSSPKVAKMCIGIEHECAAQLHRVLDQAKAAGEIQPLIDTYKIVSVMMALGDGMTQRRALDPNFDAEAGFELLFSVLDILLRTPDLTGPADPSDHTTSR